MVARESLRVYISRSKKALEDIDAAKINKRDRDRLEKKLVEVEDWMQRNAIKATADECEHKQKELEGVMNTIMLRINRMQNDFWEQQLVLPPGEKTIDQGGFFLYSGMDIRELIEDPD